jgi:hypothetical protein
MAGAWTVMGYPKLGSREQSTERSSPCNTRCQGRGGGTKELSDYGSDYKQAGTRRETMANDEGEGLEPSQCCLRLETEDGVHHESSRPCLLKDRRRRPEGGE